MGYQKQNDGSIVFIKNNSSRPGRKSFIESKKEAYRQYRSYTKEYNKLYKTYGNNMTSKYSYKKFKEVRYEDIDTATKLGVRQSSLKTLATEQIRTSYLAARVRVGNAKANIREAIRAEKNGEKLTRTQQVMIDELTEEVPLYDKNGNPILDKNGNVKLKRKIKEIDWKEYRAEKGVLYETYTKFGGQGNFEEEVFGSP